MNLLVPLSHPSSPPLLRLATFMRWPPHHPLANLVHPNSICLYLHPTSPTLHWSQTLPPSPPLRWHAPNMMASLAKRALGLFFSIIISLMVEEIKEELLGTTSNRMRNVGDIVRSKGRHESNTS